MPENAALIDLAEPSCFACGFGATKPDEHTEIWSVWNKARLDRCHLTPRRLGGDESPSNLVLLCRSCHRDAPNVADPKYMLSWIAEREDYCSRIISLIRRALDAAQLEDLIATFNHDDFHEHARLFSELLRTWTGNHGGYITESTLQAVIVESLRQTADSLTGPPKPT